MEWRLECWTAWDLIAKHNLNLSVPEHEARSADYYMLTRENVHFDA